jgi:hypothetical protein
MVGAHLLRETPMERRTYGPKLAPLNRTASGWRLTVRMGSSNTLACEVWQEVLGSRGFYHEMEQIDRWYADSPLVVVRTMEDVKEVLAEGLLQRGLPGIG